MKTYTELVAHSQFLDRFKYLKIDGFVGEDTFGFDRYLNQKFYRSKEWKRVRNEVIIRDDGCDLGIPDRPISGRVYIHHMNPINVNDILDVSDILLNPEYLICVSHQTHNALHYGDEGSLPKDHVERKANDTKLW